MSLLLVPEFTELRGPSSTDNLKEEADKAKKEEAAAKSETEKAKSETTRQTWRRIRRRLRYRQPSPRQRSGDCAKAYVSALGKLFEGESVKPQVEVVKKELESITSTCKAALAD